MELDPATNARIINNTSITHEIVGEIDLTDLEDDDLVDYFKDPLPIIPEEEDSTNE